MTIILICISKLDEKMTTSFKKPWIKNKNYLWYALCTTTLLGIAFAAENSAQNVKRTYRTAVHPITIEGQAKPAVEQNRYSRRSEYSGDLLIPILQKPNSTTLPNLRYVYQTRKNNFVFIGLVHRRLINPNFMLGLYGFYDYINYRYFRSYSAATLGAEVLTDRIDARANLYLVPSKTRKRMYASQRTTIVEGGSPLVIRRENCVSLYKKRTLWGFDGEIGLRSDLPWKQLEWRNFVGGFHFDRSRAKDITGIRLRTELRWKEPFFANYWFNQNKGALITFGAEYRHDNRRGDALFFEARLRIPLGSVSQLPKGLMERSNQRVIRDVPPLQRCHRKQCTPGTLAEEEIIVA